MMSTPKSSTLAKTFRILDLFRDHSTLTAQVCANELSMPRSTAYRFLISLRDLGVLESSSEGRYQLSMMLFELGSLAPLRRRLTDRARLPLESLAQETGFPVHLAVRRDLHVLYLETLPGGRTRNIPTRVGQRGPIHATALGKMLLAYAPEEIIAGLTSENLDRFTLNTVDTVEKLQGELERIRQQGVAYDREECLLGLTCVAAPVRGRDGKVVASVSISTSTAAMAQRRDYFRARLLQTTKAIEDGLVWEVGLDRVLNSSRSRMVAAGVKPMRSAM